MNWWKNLKGRVSHSVPLSKLTTFKIGGPVRFFIEPKDIADLKLLFRLNARNKIPVLVIGAGSNILAADKGLNAIVIKLDSVFFKKISVSNNTLTVGAGCLNGQVIRFCKEHGLSGLEFLSGIPGTLGGALAMNAGLPDKNIGDLVVDVTVMDYRGRIKILRKKQIKFGYRESSLAGYVILSARLKFFKKDKAKIDAEIGEYLKARANNQDLRRPSAGCIFKNHVMFPAGKLIDQCGLKMKKIGSACISEKHANFIVNNGGAKARDVLGLIKLVRREVKNKFNITLEPEIKIWK